MPLQRERSNQKFKKEMVAGSRDTRHLSHVAREQGHVRPPENHERKKKSQKAWTYCLSARHGPLPPPHCVQYKATWLRGSKTRIWAPGHNQAKWRKKSKKRHPESSGNARQYPQGHDAIIYAVQHNWTLKKGPRSCHSGKNAQNETLFQPATKYARFGIPSRWPNPRLH